MVLLLRESTMAKSEILAALKSLETSFTSYHQNLRRFMTDFDSRLYALTNTSPFFPNSLLPQSTIPNQPNDLIKKIEITMSDATGSTANVDLIAPTLSPASLEPLSTTFNEDLDDDLCRTLLPIAPLHSPPLLLFQDTRRQLPQSKSRYLFSPSLSISANGEKLEEYSSTPSSLFSAPSPQRCVQIRCARPILWVFYGRETIPWTEEPPEFQVCHSLGGGTMSGMGTLLLSCSDVKQPQELRGLNINHMILSQDNSKRDHNCLEYSDYDCDENEDDVLPEHQNLVQHLIMELFFLALCHKMMRSSMLLVSHCLAPTSLLCLQIGFIKSILRVFYDRAVMVWTEEPPGFVLLVTHCAVIAALLNYGKSSRSSEVVGPIFTPSMKKRSGMGFVLLSSTASSKTTSLVSDIIASVLYVKTSSLKELEKVKERFNPKNNGLEAPTSSGQYGISFIAFGVNILSLTGGLINFYAKFLSSNEWELLFMEVVGCYLVWPSLNGVISRSLVVYGGWEIEKSPFCYLSFFSICGYKHLCPAALLVKYHEFVPYSCIGSVFFSAHRLEMGDEHIDGKESGHCSGGCATFADFGTSLLAGSTTAVAIINNVIGAVGVVSQECKIDVGQHGIVIMYIPMVETQPNKICSQAGRSTFDGARGVSVGEKNSKSSGLLDAMCSEMVVVWMQNHLRQKHAKDRILNYVNKFFERLPSSMGKSVECASLSSMPSIFLPIGDEREGTYKEIKKESEGKLRGILGYIKDEVMFTDDNQSSIVDVMTRIALSKNLVKFVSLTRIGMRLESARCDSSHCFGGMKALIYLQHLTHLLQEGNHHLEDKVVLKVWGNDTPIGAIGAAHGMAQPQPNLKNPNQPKGSEETSPTPESSSPSRNRKIQIG